MSRDANGTWSLSFVRRRVRQEDLAFRCELRLAEAHILGIPRCPSSSKRWSDNSSGAAQVSSECPLGVQSIYFFKPRVSCVCPPADSVRHRTISSSALKMWYSISCSAALESRFRSEERRVGK